MPAPSFEQVLNTANSLNSLVNKYIVSPALNFGIAGIVFDVERETRVEIQSDITDHYVEDNSAVEDHIALRPTRLTLAGYFGELVDESPKENQQLQNLTEKLTIINSFLPVLTSAAQQIKNNIETKKTTSTEYLDASINSGQNLYQAFRQINPPATKQAKAFNFLRALRDSRQILGVETPYTYYPSMVIESVAMVQGEDSKYISDVVVTLKEWRSVQTQFVNFDFNKYQSRGISQRSEVQDKGKAQGKVQPEQSLLRQLSNWVGR
jgi:hypothetical protein